MTSIHVPRLKMRGRIRNLELAVDAIFVERACAEPGYGGFVPPRRRRLHRMRPIEHDFDPFGRRRPEAERDSGLMQLCAKAHIGRHAVPANARTERGGAGSAEREANCFPRRGVGPVSTRTVQCP